MIRRTVIATLALGLVLGATGSATAHTHVDILDGQYELTVGWTNEPPFAGVKNGLDLRVDAIVQSEADDGHDHDHGDREKIPVDGLLGNLTVTYEYAGQTFQPVDFRAAHGAPGRYTGEITPTRTGTYTVHIVGTIDGQAFDVRVEPAPIEALDETMFPVKDPSPEDLQDRIDDLERQVAALQTQAQQNANDPADTTPAKKNTPTPGALLVALAAVGVAVLARRR